MEHVGDNLVFTINNGDCGSYCAIITIKLPLVEEMYQQVLLEQKKHFQAEGFSKGTVPLTYIEYTCKNYILEHLKEFFFNHCIINFLCQELYNNKIVIAGEPQLTRINFEPSRDAEFVFNFRQIKPESRTEWKRYRFKAPGRKNYKDLDRQVETFLETETKNQQEYKIDSGIQPSDWICFSIEVAHNQNSLLLKTHKNELWLRIGREEADKDAHAIFIGKHAGDTFTTQSNFLQKYLSTKLDTNYDFKVTILDHIPDAFFVIDDFKYHFNIKSIKDLHRKLIEVFSYRNDISQRREIAEAALKTLLKHHSIKLPEELVQQQQNMVLQAVRRNPDYHVYKAQKDFNRKVRLLAEKQLQEAILIDHISYQESISINQRDIAAYFNLLQRPRTKEFIYFDLPPTQISGQEQPLPAGLIHRSCLREKTLNHIIRHLTS